MGREARDKVTDRRRGKERVEQGRRSRGPWLGTVGCTCTGVPEFLVAPLLMGQICLLASGPV